MLSYYENVPRWIREISWHLKTQEICDEAVWTQCHGLYHLCQTFLRQQAYVLKQLEEIHTHLNVFPIT